MSGSIAIISEALHSGSDLVAAIIAFYSVRKAGEPPDLHHHYGHEKVENLSGVIEALLIIAAAGVIIYEGVLKIIDGPHIDHIWLGIGVMVISGVTNLIVSRKVLYPVATAHAVGGARGRRRPSAHRRVHVVRRGRRPAARQAHRLGDARPYRRHRRGPAHHQDGVRARGAVHAGTARSDPARGGARRRSAAASRTTAATSSGATTSCALVRPAAAATSTCTSPSTRP